MRIISARTIRLYYEAHPESKSALQDWFKKVEAAEWSDFSDMRRTFNSVDYVGNQHYVFNIKGNDFRLVAVVKFTVHFVLIRFIGTHSEYDKIKDIANI
ncbi:MAG: type II toxin-antitoxin system HigB family toxin [Barnesiella sp.]|nr:type II toxin-antitoxin system HigB family toxin [Barnesiella sp.]